MKKRIILIWLTLVFLLFSCGSDSDGKKNKGVYNGFYETTKYKKQENSCSGEFKPAEVFGNEYKFFKLVEKSNMGREYYQMYSCDDNSESSCETRFGTSLSEYTRNSWSDNNGDTCILRKVEFSIESTPEGVRITEIDNGIEIPGMNSEDCQNESVDNHKGELKCMEVIVREGKKL